MKLHKPTCLIRSGLTCNCGAVETKVRENLAMMKPLSGILADKEYWRIVKLIRNHVTISRIELRYMQAKQQALNSRKWLRWHLGHDDVRFEGGMTQ